MRFSQAYIQEPDTHDFVLPCYKCSRGKDEDDPNFRHYCFDGVQYLPQVSTDEHGHQWDHGGVFVCCGYGCVDWLVNKAKKHGLQTKVVHYRLIEYQRCGQKSWRPAKNHSYLFIKAACDDDDERALAKTHKKKKNAKTRKRKRAPRSNAGSAIPTALPPAPAPPDLPEASAAASATAGLADLPEASGSASATAGLAEPVPECFDEAKSAVISLQATGLKMRKAIQAFVDNKDPSGGTCNSRARVIMNCHLNHMQEQIVRLSQAVFGCCDAASGPPLTQLALVD